MKKTCKPGEARTIKIKTTKRTEVALKTTKSKKARETMKLRKVKLKKANDFLRIIILFSR